MDNDLYMMYLHEAVFDTKLGQTDDPDEVLNMLEVGADDITLSLKWGQKGEGKNFDEHKIVLQELTGDDRVVFFNPLRDYDDLAAGTMIGGESGDPERMVEAEGMESVTLEQFRSFFEERDAVCYYPVEE